MKQIKPSERVKVAKPDGSLQCDKAPALSLDEMRKELLPLQVFSAENKPDGLMHMQLCGSPTGRYNVYEISRADLEAAKKLGFHEWTGD